jgi:DNA-binding beta-propeller fold protein YncE
VGDESSGSIQVFSLAGSLLASVPVPIDGTPAGMAIGPNGNLYVADQANSVVDEFNGSTGAFISQFIPQGSGAAALSTPSGVTFDASGNLYVANFGAGGQSYVNEYNGTTGAFISQFIPAGYPGSFGGLDYPGGLVFHGGNLYIADSSNGSIDEFSSTGAYIQQLALPGVDIDDPEDLTFGPDGNIYVADVTLSEVVVFAASGNFLGSFSGNLDDPIGLAFGTNGELYVTDGQGRVALFTGVLSGGVDPQLADFVPPGGSGGPLINPQFLAFSESGAPEPSSIAMLALALGCGGLCLAMRRKTAASGA